MSRIHTHHDMLARLGRASRAISRGDNSPATIAEQHAALVDLRREANLIASAEEQREAAIAKVKAEGLKCEVCNTAYGSYGDPAWLQGTDCAAAGDYTVHGEYVVRGFYGSRSYDMTELRAARAPQGWPEGRRAEPVCDACITFARNAGQLREVVEWEPHHGAEPEEEADAE